MIIVKLGGSLYGTAELKLWLDTLREYAEKQAIVIVPGGGPFADQVRTAQQTHHFDDNHAHHMAILAMAQFGLLISGICAESQLFSFPPNHQLRPTGLFVWIPDSRLLSDTKLPHSWDISSDSLALWLANELNSEQLILVKQANATGHTSITELIKLDIIDSGFKSLFSHNPIDSYILSASDYSLFTKSFFTDIDYRLSLP